MARDNKSAGGRSDGGTATAAAEQSQARTARIKTIEGYLPENKLGLMDYEAQERYGIQKRPVVADECFVREVQHNRKGVLAETWILINGKANTMSFVNTFDGKTGANFNLDDFTFPIDVNKLNEKRAGMEKVSVDECPVAISHDDAKGGGYESSDR